MRDLKKIVKKSKKIYFWLIIHFLSIFYSGLALAVTAPVSNSIYAPSTLVLNNINKMIPALTKLLIVAVYLAGIYMVFKALLMFKKNAGSTQGHGGELSGPLAHLVIGGVLLFIPSATDVTIGSIFGNTKSIFANNTLNYANLGKGSQLLNYASNSAFAAQWAPLADTLVLILQFVGFIAFLRGWFILAKASESHNQQASFGKGLTHILGGALAINFVNAVMIIKTSLYGPGN
ncbi:MAG: icmC [Francisellaceae bacterium]|nr:icmC [Francisellaceae bacterium]